MGVRGDGSVSAWLRAETPEHLALLSRMRERLVRKLDRADKADGEPSGERRDPVPDRDWCRLAQRYQTGYHALLVEERERSKLALMARLRGDGHVLTDEEYETGLRELQQAALKDLPPADLEAELARRGIKMPALDAGADPDESDDG